MTENTTNILGKILSCNVFFLAYKCLFIFIVMFLWIKAQQKKITGSSKTLNVSLLLQTGDYYKDELSPLLETNTRDKFGVFPRVCDLKNTSATDPNAQQEIIERRKASDES